MRLQFRRAGSPSAPEIERKLAAIFAADVAGYAAAYMLDRQEVAWTYVALRRQAVRSCLSEGFKSDADGSSNLLEDVLDRARGRVKRELWKDVAPLG
jgi:hypothetical protein